MCCLPLLHLRAIKCLHPLMSFFRDLLMMVTDRHDVSRDVIICKTAQEPNWLMIIKFVRGRINYVMYVFLLNFDRGLAPCTKHDRRNNLAWHVRPSKVRTVVEQHATSGVL